MRYQLHIDRTRWSTGRLRRVVREKENYLRDSRDGRCCALGFYAKQVLGMSDAKITDRNALTSITGFSLDYPEARWLHAQREGDIIEVNDSPTMAAATRERLLRDHFEKLDTDLTFSGVLAR